MYLLCQFRLIHCKPYPCSHGREASHNIRPRVHRQYALTCSFSLCSALSCCVQRTALRSADSVHVGVFSTCDCYPRSSQSLTVSAFLHDSSGTFKMPIRRKIDEATWEFHRAQIVSLYCTSNFTLDKVMSTMVELHGFAAR